MIFVLLGRRNALCLARHNRTKSAKISRFQASSDLLLYLREGLPPPLSDHCQAASYIFINSATSVTV